MGEDYGYQDPEVEIKESGKCISDPWGSKGFGMR